MASFNKVWAIKHSALVQDGSTINVALKSGKTKPVVVEKFLFSRQLADGTTYYYYLPAKQEEE